MLIFACVIYALWSFWILDSWHVKAVIRINQWEITHCTSESAKEQSEEIWQSAIRVCIYLHNVIAFGKRQYENDEEQHEVDDIVNHLDHHHDQKAELPEYSDEIEHFDQWEHYAEYKQNPANVSGILVCNIQDWGPLIEKNAQELKIIPKVFEVLLLLFPELDDFVHQEVELDELTNDLANNEMSIFDSWMDINFSTLVAV